jgi:pSer/pThr/pTyr-binding forkhead associated (FHA) protein
MATNPRLKLLPDGPFIEIDGGALYLGRDCILVTVISALANKVVSNRHCCIKNEPDGRWTLEDLKTTNGTWLRADRLKRKTVLVSGDVFSLGRFGPRFECDLPLPVDPNATMREDEFAAAATMLESPEGSAERPYKVGKTPELGLRHDRTGEEFAAKGYTIVLGRDANSVQIVIKSNEEKHISSRHAEIQFRAGGVVVLRDLGSRNGTWLNDTPVKQEAGIRVGDKLVLGAPATTLTVTRLDS